MYKLQEGRAYNFYTLGNCIEGDNLPTAVDVQFPWEAHPRRSHQYMLDMPALAATRFPVTNEDYWHFLQVTLCIIFGAGMQIFLCNQETGWRPADEHNWLRHWGGADSYPEGHGRKPVTWVR